MTTETTDLPVMKGNAAMATGASDYFEVPLFSHVIGNLWQGCSPAEFPDELMPGTRVLYFADPGPQNCKWLMEDIFDTDAEIELEDGHIKASGQRPRFDKILNLYQWGDYAVPEGTERVTVEMYDGHGVPDQNQVDELADMVIAWMHEDQRVLVHCQAGLNRSSLIVARVLMKRHKMTADEAIQHIRDSRSPLCLCNDNFRQWLKGLR